jgi:bifunctional DNA-binding transcriptional regulator/antitoxin component of YhaV-PrlF toxin-antitoxin module
MSKISGKHQVTLPVRVLKDAGLAAGDEVVIRAVGRGRIEVERAADVIDRYAGSLPAGTYGRGYLERLRHEWRA